MAPDAKTQEFMLHQLNGCEGWFTNFEEVKRNMLIIGSFQSLESEAHKPIKLKNFFLDNKSL